MRDSPICSDRPSDWRCVWCRPAPPETKGGRSLLKKIHWNSLMFRIISRSESESAAAKCSISGSLLSADNDSSAQRPPPFFVEWPDSRSRLSIERAFAQPAEALRGHPRGYRKIRATRLKEADGKIQDLEERLQASRDEEVVSRAETKLTPEATRSATKRA